MFRGTARNLTSTESSRVNGSGTWKNELDEIHGGGLGMQRATTQCTDATMVLPVVYLAISEVALTRPFIEVLGGFVPSVLPVSVTWLYNSVIELVEPELFGGRRGT